jgi:hypothetical protein
VALVARQLKVWVHRLTPEGDSVGLAGVVVVERSPKEPAFDLSLSGGQVALPLDGETRRVEIKLAEELGSKE